VMVYQLEVDNRSAHRKGRSSSSAEGIRILASSPGASRVNAICERMVETLRRALTTYLHHFNAARPHGRSSISHRLRPRPTPMGDQSRRLPHSRQPDP
jgi:transposase InsO family protein